LSGGQEGAASLHNIVWMAMQVGDVLQSLPYLIIRQSQFRLCHRFLQRLAPDRIARIIRERCLYWRGG
jgi:hypothetical protein